MSDRYTTVHGLPAASVKSIRMVESSVVAETAAGQATFANGRWRAGGEPAPSPFPFLAGARLPEGATVLSAAGLPSGKTFVVTNAGVFQSSGSRYVPFTFPRRYLTQQTPVNIDAEISCVAVDAQGLIWFGSNVGIFSTDGAEYWNVFDRTTGLPYEYITNLALGPDGQIWAGTREGVCRYVNGAWQYYWGPRWLPNNRVNSILPTPDGGAWVATEGGVARIHDRPMTLAQKAAHYQQITDTRHNRYGFISGCRLKVPGDPTKGHILNASDNDGLWTAIYAGAQCFRYAATKDPAAREAARKSMFAMLDMVKVTGIKGFPARAFFRKGEEVDGYDPNETVRIDGEKDKIWFQSPVDPQVLCKGDTSSDELDGHYFTWLVFHDLVATPEEKQRVRAVVEAVTDNILDHDYSLVGPTGRKTRWGVYGPKYVNDDPTWWEERGLNSLSMLSYLKIAHHIVGKERYRREFRELIDKHHYLLNLVRQKVAEPWHGVNHSDDQMAFLMYYAFFHLEQDPAIRRVLLQSIDRSWRYERPEASPFFNFVYGAATGSPCDLERSAESLREWPWELVEWECRASQRHDVTVRTSARESRSVSELTTVLPPSERRLMRWNGNPYQADGGSPNGAEEDCGSAWLISYWMGRYHKFLGE